MNKQLKLPFETTKRVRGPSTRELPDLTGQTFNWLTVLSLEEQRSKLTQRLWRCICVCGKERIVSTNHLQFETVKSCGCKSFAEHPNGKKQAPNVTTLNAKINACKQTARHKQQEWSLTTEQATKILFGNCYYCGIHPFNTYNVYKTKNGKYRQQYCKERMDLGAIIINGIDRVENSKGYFIENCVSCCYQCNFAKHTQPINEFLDWISRLTDHYTPFKQPNFIVAQARLDILRASLPREYKDKRSSKISKDISILNAGLCQLRAVAKYRNIKWSLQEEEARLLVLADCIYCGMAPANIISYQSYNTQKIAINGIDRIDNNIRVYSSNNSVTCCFKCNRAKRNQSKDDFEAWIYRIKEFRENQNENCDHQ